MNGLRRGPGRRLNIIRETCKVSGAETGHAGILHRRDAEDAEISYSSKSSRKRMIYCEGPLGNPVPARAIRLLGCGTRLDRLILQKAASAGISSFVGGRPIRLW